MQNKNSILRPIVALALLLALSGFTLKACSRPPKEATKPITLTWWRVFDDDDTLRPMIDAFHKQHPNISVNFRRLRFEEYEEELLNALAEDRGPDIVSLHNTWIGKYQAKLTPAPASVTLPYQFEKGAIKKEIVTQLRTSQGITPRALRQQFIDVVIDDIIRSEQIEKDQPPQEKIFGVPLSVDTLALYYNIDLLNAAGIPEPAHTWAELQEHIKRLTKLQGEKIVQAGAALGTSKNIPRAPDILSLLMMQNGTLMTDDRGFATFDRIPPGPARSNTLPGAEALAFYTDFANPTKEVYTWNTAMPDALELFAQGRLGYFMGYSYHAPVIRARSPKLRFRVASIPQIEENPEVNFANYWVEAVSRKSKEPNAAWGFLQFITDTEQARGYVSRSERPPALRALIAEFSENPDLSPFTRQLLTAKSWYRGVNASATEHIMEKMIDTVADGSARLEQALNTAVGQINQTIR